VKDHGPGCQFPKIFGDITGVLLATSVFALALERPKSGSAAERPRFERDPRLLYPTFSALAFGLAADAYLEAFMAGNPFRPPQVQPTNTQFFHEWDRVLSEPRFAGGVDAREAARLEGVEIKLGIVFREPAICASGRCLFSGFWWDGSQLVAIVYTAGAALIEKAMTVLKGRHSVLPPPYLAVAAVEADGSVRNLWLHGIWTDGTHLALIDSGCERLYASIVRLDNGVFFKAPRIADLEELAAVMPAAAAGIHWEHLPDFAVWWPQSAESDLATIVEVCGTKPNPEDPSEYDLDFDAKQPFFESLRTGFGLEYKVEEAWRYTRGEKPFPRSDWISPAIVRGWMSDSALALLRAQVGSPLFATAATVEPVGDKSAGLVTPGPIPPSLKVTPEKLPIL
jgi:predicted heme/steroid binding protein